MNLHLYSFLIAYNKILLFKTNTKFVWYPVEIQNFLLKNEILLKIVKIIAVSISQRICLSFHIQRCIMSRPQKPRIPHFNSIKFLSTRRDSLQKSLLVAIFLKTSFFRYQRMSYLYLKIIRKFGIIVSNFRINCDSLKNLSKGEDTITSKWYCCCESNTIVRLQANKHR